MHGSQTPNMEARAMKHLAVDTETRLIGRGIDAAPELVCVSFCGEDFKPGLLHHSEAEAFLQHAFSNYIVVGANFAFDACVLLRRFPQLTFVIYQAYDEGRVLDVQNAQRLIDLGQGQLNGYRHASGEHIRYLYNLAALFARYDLGTMAKGEDTWRLRYGELINTPVHEWPESAREYAEKDALGTLQVWFKQQQFNGYLQDLPAQCRKALELQKMTVRGMITDGPTCDKFYQETVAEIERCKKELIAAGLVRPAVGKKEATRNLKAAKARMRAICEELDLEPKLTAKGQELKKAGAPAEELWDYVCLDAEATRDSGDPLLRDYSTYTSATTILNKAETLKEGSKGLPLQTEFDVLKENGRCSSRIPKAPKIGVQMQNLPTGGLMRKCFVARSGYALVSIDFNMHELVTVSQCQIWFAGASKLAEALNQDRDVHCDVGAGLLGCTYDEILANKKVKDSKYEKARKQSKEVNFGGWGVMTPQRLMLQMNKKRKPGDEIVSERRAYEIMNAWETRWEPQSYFDAVGALFPDGNRWGLATIKQFISGRIRANCTFPDACNGFFSGLAADAASAAYYAVGRACSLGELRDCHLLVPIHDEILMEIPLDGLHEYAYRARDLFVGAAQQFTPDVKLSAEPAAMFAYDKNADTVKKDGELQVWTP